MKKILITGIAGFAGSFLAEYFVKKGNTSIFGTTLSQKDSQNLDLIKEHISLSEVNLLEAEKVATLIEDIRPDSIFHLAAIAAASQSFASPVQTISNNISSQ